MPDLDIPEWYEVKCQYQRHEPSLYVVLALLLFGSLWLFTPEAVQTLQGYWTDKISLKQVLLSGISHFPLFAVGIILTLVVHEPVHKIVAELLGYEAEIRWGVFSWPPTLSEPHVQPLDETVEPNEAIIAIMAPLFVVGFLAALLFFTQLHPWIIFLGKAMLLINTTSSSADLYDTYQYWKLPEGYLLHFTSGGEILEPYILQPIQDVDN